MHVLLLPYTQSSGTNRHTHTKELQHNRMHFIYFLMTMYLRESVGGGGAERGRESQVGSALPVQTLMQGLIPQTVRPELKSRVRCLTD